ncbi:MAG TPA: glutathione S-transferase [Candidatus Binataceae bacterium]|nr:glutathione S-transferase [Candidatus Binataceae bacterium]
MLKLVGAYGSPYSCKMRAVLRYRRIPFRWIVRGSGEDVGIPEVPVAIIPVLVFPGESGMPDTAMVDSSPQIRRLEELYTDRRVIPPDRALAFLDLLIEDYADEWMTKQMFHYRWSYPADIAKAGKLLPLDRQPQISYEQLEKISQFISNRQINRLGVVGSNPITRSVIEDSYRRILGILDRHIEGRMFMMGARPASSDFGIFGQLSQLIGFDPTPSAIAIEIAPRVVSWVNRMEDLSGLDVTDSEWMARDGVELLRPVLEEIGRVYVPFLLANAAALESGAKQVECEIDGRPWVQEPFPYQGKCLRWLREAHVRLDSSDRTWVDSVLAGTGCERMFAA